MPPKKKKKRGPGGPGKPFVEGDQRINRSGVSKDMVAANKLLRAMIERELEKACPLEPSGKISNLEHLLGKLMLKAVGGDLPAAQFLLEKWVGKTPQPVEASGPGGSALRCVVLKESELSDGLHN